MGDFRYAPRAMPSEPQTVGGTPRTDAVVADHGYPGLSRGGEWFYLHSAGGALSELCRRLERERDALSDELRAVTDGEL